MSEFTKKQWNAGWSEMALNQSVYPVIWVKEDGRIVKFNQSLIEKTGYTSDELETLVLFDLDESLTKKSWKNIWEKTREEHAGFADSQLTTKAGKILPVEMNFTLVKSTQPPLCCIFINDISQRKELALKLKEANFLLERIVDERAEGSKMTYNALKAHEEAIEQLSKLQRSTRLILDSVGEGIYGLDINGHTTFVNPAARRMVGYELEELVGKLNHDIIHHTHPDGSHYEGKDCPIYAAFKDGEIHEVCDEVFWRKDGTSFPVEYVSTPIKDSEGNLAGAVVVFKDITRRKEDEKALLKANEDLAKALEEVSILKNQLEQENQYLQQEIKVTHNFTEIISESKKFKTVLRQIEQVAPTDASVLILGESGTGKELIARAVHNLSNRQNRPLVKVNCAALPANLIESELFGHERGAFTGALTKKTGRFELADGGTIFLDEVGEMPLELQPKLLRVLQEGEFERLGNARTTKVNVRVIAATNRDLQKEVDNGNFREDLFYRLNVFPLHVPPLRDRAEDIPLLVRHFLMKYGKKFGKTVDTVSQKVMYDLIKYPWPGNVRELENVIERALIISPGKQLNIGNSLPRLSGPAGKKRIETLEENERNHILKALEFTNWRISGDKGAARLLDIKRTTLEARMKKLGIERP